MTRRPGLSLTEVLVALFIMGIGTISLLTMFPLGALQMGQALKDDRTAQAATQAEAYLRWYWRTNVVENPGNTEPFVQALDNPDGTTPAPSPTRGFTTVAGGTGPSYPVFVDPMGCALNTTGWGNNNNSAQQYWVGNQNVPRCSLNQITTQGTSFAQRICSLLDGFGYDASGLPRTAANEMRELRYNWAWVVQRPKNTDKNTATMTVVVYDKRAFQFAPKNAEQVFTPTTASVGSTKVQFDRSAPLLIQKGGWIADVTVDTSGSGVRNMNFYRVVSMTDDGSNLNVELQTPLQDTGGTVTAANQRRFVVLFGVSEVFVRPNLTADN